MDPSILALKIVFTDIKLAQRKIEIPGSSKKEKAVHWDDKKDNLISFYNFYI